MSKAKNALITLVCGDAYGNAYEMEGLMGAKFDKSQLPNEAQIKNYTLNIIVRYMHVKNS